MVYYCSVEHQKQNWSFHKVSCNKQNSIQSVEISGKNSSKPAVETAAESSDVKGNESGETNQKKSVGSSTQDEKKNSVKDDPTGKRQSRCMFCGEELVLGSEEDAVDHMRVCVALQEQLESPDQFTIPKALREKNKIWFIYTNTLSNEVHFVTLFLASVSIIEIHCDEIDLLYDRNLLKTVLFLFLTFTLYPCPNLTLMEPRYDSD
jgi:MYND finger